MSRRVRHRPRPTPEAVPSLSLIISRILERGGSERRGADKGNVIRALLMNAVWRCFLLSLIDSRGKHGCPELGEVDLISDDRIFRRCHRFWHGFRLFEGHRYRSVVGFIIIERTCGMN